MLGSAGAGSPGCPLACEHRVLLYRLGIGSGAASSIIGGGGRIFIYLCSQTIKTIDFKRS